MSRSVNDAEIIHDSTTKNVAAEGMRNKFLLSARPFTVWEGTYGVVGVRHGVEGPHSQRVFVQHVEVGVVLE